MLIKASILLEWTHMLVPNRSQHLFFYWACHITISINALFYLSIIVAMNFTCIPRDKIWRRWLPGKCFNIENFNISLTSFDLIFNVLILLLPHQVIWRLSLSTKQKLGVSVIFSVGIMYVTCLFLTYRMIPATDYIYIGQQNLRLCCRPACCSS